MYIFSPISKAEFGTHFEGWKNLMNVTAEEMKTGAPLEMRIHQITHDGKLELRFNQDIIVPEFI